MSDEQNIQMNITESPININSSQNSKQEESTSNDQLTLQTLVNVKQLIEVAIKRGAYNPSELSMVGNIYDAFSNNVVKMVDESNKNSK